MKIETRSAIFVLLLIVLQVNVDYLSTMGMHWGFSTDDIFWFTMNYTGEFDDLVDCDVYLQAK